MGYGYQIPANQVGKHKILWDFRGYGVQGSWVRRGSTVIIIGFSLRNAISYLLSVMPLNLLQTDLGDAKSYRFSGSI